MEVVILQNDFGEMSYLINPLKEIGIKARQSTNGIFNISDDVIVVRSNSQPLKISGEGDVWELNRQCFRANVYDKIEMRKGMEKFFSKKYLIPNKKSDITVLKKKFHQAGNGIWFLTNKEDIRKIKSIYSVTQEQFIPFDSEYRLIVFCDWFCLVEKYLIDAEKAIGTLVRASHQGYGYRLISTHNLLSRSFKEGFSKDVNALLDIVYESKGFGLDFYTIDLGRYNNRWKVIELNSTLPMPISIKKGRKIIGETFARAIQNKIFEIKGAKK